MVLTSIAEVQKELDAAELARNADLYARANESWHRAIIQGSGNDLLVASLERLRVPIFRIQLQAFHAADTIERANADHRLVGDLIRSGRAFEAEEQKCDATFAMDRQAIEAMGDELFA